MTPSWVVSPLPVTSRSHNKGSSEIPTVLLGMETPREELPKKPLLLSQHCPPRRQQCHLPQVPLRTALLSQGIYHCSLSSKIHHFTNTPMDVIFFNCPLLLFPFSCAHFQGVLADCCFPHPFVRPWLPQDEGHQP